MEDRYEVDRKIINMVSLNLIIPRKPESGDHKTADSAVMVG